MKKYNLICSKDGNMVDYSEDIYAEDEPDYWTCQEIAEKHGCSLFHIFEA